MKQIDINRLEIIAKENSYENKTSEVYVAQKVEGVNYFDLDPLVCRVDLESGTVTLPDPMHQFFKFCYPTLLDKGKDNVSEFLNQFHTFRLDYQRLLMSLYDPEIKLLPYFAIPFEINNASEDSIKQSFDEIALFLFSKSVLVINELNVFPVDIEFYYYDHNSGHTDSYTLEPNENKRPIGELEAHRYGVDISLGNDDKTYGGILIKGLWKAETVINENLTKDLFNANYIPKSRIKTTLINSLYQGTNSIHWKHDGERNIKPFKTNRNISYPQDNISKQKFYDSKYRYLIDVPCFIRNYEGKEKVFAQSNLPKDENTKKRYLGYHTS